jgi:hypothetical protein
MRLTIKFFIVIYLILMIKADNIISESVALVMFCGLLFIDIVIIPQIDWKRKQQKKGSS